MCDAASRCTTFTYTNNRVTQISDPASRTTTFNYDGTGRLATTADAAGNTTTYSYDTAGRVNRVTTARGVTVDVAYDTQNRVTEISRYTDFNAAGTKQTTRFAYPDTTTTTQTNPLGKVWTSTRDNAGRITAVKDPLGHTRSQTWTANSSIATATDAMGAGGVGGNITRYTYDTANNPTQVKIPTGAMTSATYTSGSSCGSTDTSNPDRPKCLVDDAGNKTAMTYDPAGNLLTQKDTTVAGGAEIRYTYAVKNSTNPDTNCSPIAGQMCTATDRNGNKTRYTYDQSGNMTKATPPAPVGEQAYEYDTLGRLTATINGRGQKVTYAYDNLDRLTSTTRPASGPDPAYTRTQTFDADSNMTYNEANLTYDAQNRQISLQDESAQAAGGQHTISYDPAGNIATATDITGGVTTYTYDDANQLIAAGFPGATCAKDTTHQPGCVKFAYNNNGAETRRIFPNDADQVTTRDGSGRATAIKGNAPADTTHNGVLTDHTYSYQKAGTTGETGDRMFIQTATDKIGRPDFLPANTTTSYSYSTLNRLTAAVEKDATGNTTASWGYTNQGNGNRSQQVRSGTTLGYEINPGTLNYTYNAASELTAINANSTNLTYDADGNELKNPGGPLQSGPPQREQRVTADNEVPAITTTKNGTSTTYSYAYNHANPGQKVIRWAHGNTYQHSPIGLDSTKHDTTGTRVKYLLHPNGNALAYQIDNAAPYYYLTDRQGTIVGSITGDNGIEAAYYRYDPYGHIRWFEENYNPAAPNTIMFHGMLLDYESGLYRPTWRWYDAATGRYTQPDPSTAETNPYLFTEGNPCNNTDPTGLASPECGLSIMASIGATLLAGGVIAGAIVDPEPASKTALALGISGSLMVAGAAYGSTALACRKR